MKLLVLFICVAAVYCQEFNCLPNPIASCNNHGICIDNGTFGFQCKCDNNWDNQGCPPNVQCCNELEPRVKVFLLAFFVGWTGAPYFVIGATGLGIGILLLCVCGNCLAGIGKAQESSVLMTIGGLAAAAAMVWHLATWIMAAASTEVFDNSKVGSW